jgi:cytochrome o ubiquinol oxidase subunit 1
MHFFTNAGGGNMMMYANLLWIWGHPEVYILILPAFGIYSHVVATFSGKPLFGYASLVYATAAITILSFTVWLHHFFTMGSSANVNAAFGIATMIIAVPTGVKVFNWLFTMYRGRIRFHPAMLWAVGFIVTFVIGGMSGVLLALPPVDYQLHNTTFLVAHFHNMLIPGALFGYFAGVQFWFPKAFGFRLNERWGAAAFWCWIIGFYLAFMPLYVLGMMAMPRRLEHYNIAGWQPYLILAALGACLILAGLALMIGQLLVSFRQREELRDLTGDPWQARSLEWLTSSPPAPYNFAVIPEVRSRDAFQDMKERGVAYARPDRYVDIHLPRNSMFGVACGALAFLFGFAMVWHIWWAAIASAVGIAIAVAVLSSRDESEYRISAGEVEDFENQRYRQMATAPRPQATESAVHIPGAPLQGSLP